ncbi:hypothetical protein ILYODFUR_001736 [Ilyodon furcidens]|uniref:Uncharacterized protein n=2 Tax=Goodeidae TaxID=28758 RepID=A0ABU7CJF7_9TELE|nr:hypothetical protein [Characodon lateralis]
MCGHYLEFAFLLLGNKTFSNEPHRVLSVSQLENFSHAAELSVFQQPVSTQDVLAPSHKSELALCKQRSTFRIICSSGTDLRAINKLPSVISSGHECKKN